jgi:hypothetical protein
MPISNAPLDMTLLQSLSSKPTSHNSLTLRLKGIIQ